MFKLNQTEVIQILQELGVTRARITGDEIILACPFHQDRHPSGGLNVRKGVYSCFSCGIGLTLRVFFQKLNYNFFTKKSLSFREAVINPKSKEILSGESKPDAHNSSYEAGQLLFDKSEPISAHEQAQNYLVSRLGDNYKIPIRCQYHPQRQSLFFKSDFNFIERHISEKARYRYTLYGDAIQAVTHISPALSVPSCVIVEGIFDYIKAYNAGFDGCAILTASITPLVLSLLATLNSEEFILCPDNDKAGVRTLRKNVRLMYNFIDSPISVSILRKYKDFGEAPYPVIKQAIESRTTLAKILQTKLDRLTYG